MGDKIKIIFLLTLFVVNNSAFGLPKCEKTMKITVLGPLIIKTVKDMSVKLKIINTTAKAPIYI